MVRPRVTQPLGQPPGISDGHLMHGARDGSIRAHGQRPDGNRSGEGPGKPCGGKLALNADGRVWCSTPSQIGYRFGSGCNLRRRKSSHLLRQFGGFFIFHAPDSRHCPERWGHVSLVERRDSKAAGTIPENLRW
jgi:hypothetical protein